MPWSVLPFLKLLSKARRRIHLFSLFRPEEAIRLVVLDQTVEAQQGGQGINVRLQLKGEFSEIRYSTISKKNTTTTMTSTVQPADFCSGGLTEQETGFEWQKFRRPLVFLQVRRTEVDT